MNDLDYFQNFRLIFSSSGNVFDNLLFEQHLFDEGIKTLFIYTNNDSVVLGKNQNIFKELNRELIFNENTGIKVLRRFTGGGTVFHDQGNINFSFIDNECSYIDYELYYNLLIYFLKNKYSISKIEIKKNGLFIDDEKISGIAAHKSKSCVLVHYTLLIDTDLSKITYILSNRLEIKSKAVDSIESKVANLSQITGFDFDHIYNSLLKFLSDTFKDAVVYSGSEFPERHYNMIWVYYKSANFEIKEGDYYIKVKNGIVTKTSPRAEKLVDNYFSSNALKEVDEELARRIISG